MTETIDAVGNRIIAGALKPDGSIDPALPGHDYRVLQPCLVTDTNRNRTAVAFDALGLVAGTALSGKDESTGDRLAAFGANLTASQLEDFYAAGDPSVPARKLLQDATARIAYATISDVTLHVRYTAREGGGLLRKAATANLMTEIDAARANGSVRLFSVRHEFPSEWAKFTRQVADANGLFPLSLVLRAEHYPFWNADRAKIARHIQLFARAKDPILRVVDQDKATDVDELARDAALGLLVGLLDKVKPLENGGAVGTFKVLLGSQAIDDLWIAVALGGE